MKHVFVINSHTTFLTAMGAVDYLGLEAEDIILIYVRNYKNKIAHVPYCIVEGTDVANVCRNIGEDYKGTIRKVDEFIAHNIKGFYYLYVPHLWHYFFQLLYTNRKCMRVSYIQEGGPAQTGVYENDVSLIERIKSFIRHAILGRRIFECKWYKRGTLYKQFSLDSYAINDVYFHCLPSHNHIVKWPAVKLDVTLNVQRPIFIFDGHIANGLTEPDVYLALCKRIIFQYGTKKNYVKFHPAQCSEERTAILNYFMENGKAVEEMSDDIPMESIISQCRGLTFVGFTSSLLYFAHDYGHKVVCHERELLEASEAYRKRVRTTGIQLYSEMYES